MSDLHLVVADDHPLFRNALKQALLVSLDAVVSEAEDFTTCLDILHTHVDVDLLFLDLNMPGNAGLTGLASIRSQFPNISIVVVSAQEHPELIAKAMHIGANAYIPKSTSLEHITYAVNTVLEGEQWLPESVTSYSAQQDEVSIQMLKHLESLTPHQLKVLTMLADGLLNKQIAYELDISESTVKQHVSAVLKKLMVNNRTQAGVIFKQLMAVDY